nr:MAG TPA: hypothetical protein [Caudoviricetes sp.]
MYFTYKYSTCRKISQVNYTKIINYVLFWWK